ncbi:MULTISPECIES: anti-sigma factor [unclassified Nocardia]|uniref:anti-sigma factor n=1 Tax=unclassified Nocardia TaxID=2637762 RepID=UPI00272E1D21|nr:MULTISPECIES: anti-sigma factor [unclassified Nocardia]
MICESRSDTGAYVLDALSAIERATFESHLLDCPDCRREITELRSVTARLALALPPARAGAVKVKVLADIRAHQRLDSTAVMPPLDDLTGTSIMPPFEFDTEPARTGGHRWTTRIAAGLAATAAAATFVGGLLLLDHEQEAGAPVPLEQVRRARDAVTRDGVVVVGGGSATAVLSQSVGKVAVSAFGLPALDNEHEYQLWLVRHDGTARSAGMMRTAGKSTELVADLPEDIRLVTITAEPIAGSAGPTTPMVAQIDLA